MNFQQMPSDEITRACFVSEPGNRFISCDYQSQESRLIASISRDKALIDLFNNGCGDAHSFVAKIAYPEIVGDCPIEEIKHKFHQQRQDAKKIEFAINYAGDYNTIANNMSIPKAEAKRIYDNYMSGLAGVAKYQEYCKQIVLKKGYVTLNPILGHKAYWWDKDACLAALDLYNNKDTVALTKLNNKLHFIKVKFNGSEDWSPVHLDHIMDFTDISLVKKKISDWKKRSVNYRVQGTGAMCFKNALINFWDYLCKNNLVFIVLICLSIHDECDSEAPEEIADEVASNLLLCMKKGAATFCTEVNLEADLSLDENNKLPNYWIH